MAHREHGLTVLLISGEHGLRVHSHGRHVSNYFAVSLSLVLAIRVAQVDCKLQLAARPSRLQPVVESGDKIAAD